MKFLQAVASRTPSAAPTIRSAADRGDPGRPAAGPKELDHLRINFRSGGLPKKVFDDLQAQLAANRAQFYLEFASGPFYGFNRKGAKVSEGLIRNWWRQAMMGSAKAHYEGIVAFSQTDQTEDLKRINVPVLVGHGDDDQIVPYANAGPLSAELLKKGTLKTYRGFPHGMPFTEPATINADLLAFIRA